MTPWSFACPDWFERLKDGRRPWADLPLDMDAAEGAVAIFEGLRLPDVPGQPLLEVGAGAWFKDVIRAAFGSLGSGTAMRMINEIFLLVPKKNGKSTYTAALGLTALLLNELPNASMQILGPTKEVAQTCFDQAADMIEADQPDRETGRIYLQDRFQVVHASMEIKDRTNGAVLKVKTFDMNVITGSIPSLIIVDELHLLGSKAYAERVLAQIRGGMLPRPDALLVFITTQSDEVPAGVFKTELEYARRVRDGEIVEDVTTLPILYEFPEAVQQDETKPWLDPAMWGLLQPNLDRSVTIEGLRKLYSKAQIKGEENVTTWLSQHLNIQVGLGSFANRWTGAKLWLPAADPELTYDRLLETSDCVVAGVDGGGLDDLLGLCLLGRHRKTKNWQAWSRGWLHPEALEARKANAARYEDFQRDGDLVLCSHGTEDLEQVAAILADVHAAGLFPATAAIGLDPVGVTALVDELVLAGLPDGLLLAVAQGFRLSSAVWGAERKLKDKTLVHGNQGLLNWCVSNCRTQQRGNAVVIEKAVSGKAKIDPVIALLNAMMLMARNPVAHSAPSSPWDDPNYSIRRHAA